MAGFDEKALCYDIRINDTFEPDMTLNSIDIPKQLARMKQMLEEDKSPSDSFRIMVEIMVLIIELLLNQRTLNSKNSSKPPSTDGVTGNHKKKSSGRKPGGQPGRQGSTLKKSDEPDDIKTLNVNRQTLPKGTTYWQVGTENRQVVDIVFQRHITEYQAEVLQDEQGNRYVAPFPDGVTQPVQYGNEIKAHVVYLSQYQLLPYQRIQDYFVSQLDIPLSQGSIANFIQQAASRLETTGYLQTARQVLSDAERLHADETGVNIAGERQWLHCASNDKWTYFTVHKKRGFDAMEAADILPSFNGILCHDHWKTYFRFNCLHALCNAHHLRELIRAYEQDEQQWAGRMHALLNIINRATHRAGGVLSGADQQKYLKYYRRVLQAGEKACPPPLPLLKNKPGRLKRSKARNLLERLRDYQNEVLRFMGDSRVPFTNNQGERDIRMTKVHQKISGCFRSKEGAESFCAIRGYLSTCSKQNVSASDALRLLFKNELPEFCPDG